MMLISGLLLKMLLKPASNTYWAAPAAKQRCSADCMSRFMLLRQH
jgi:hypothetical protein